MEDYKIVLSSDKVLCYGGGQMGAWVGNYLMRLGIPVVGYIDKKRTGKLNNLPIFSIEETREFFDGTIPIIITIADSNIHDVIRNELNIAGFKNIFSYDSINWITVPSDKCYCNSLFHDVLLFTNGFAQCCNWGDNRVFIPELFDRSKSFEESCTNYIRKRKYYLNQAAKGEVPLYCANCPYLEKRDELGDADNSVEFISFAVTASCNLECVYCTAVEPKLRANLFYDAKGYGELFVQLISQLHEKNVIGKNAHISFAGGEISIHPVKEKFFQFAKAHPEYRYSFLSNCVIYDSSISQILQIDEKNFVMCDIDAGTRDTYALIKGHDYFDAVIESIKKYRSYGKVVLKYIIIPYFNTSERDYDGTLELLKQFDIKSMILSWDVQRQYDSYLERRALYDVARLKKMIESHNMNAVIEPTVFDKRQL